MGWIAGGCLELGLPIIVFGMLVLQTSPDSDSDMQQTLGRCCFLSKMNVSGCMSHVLSVLNTSSVPHRPVQQTVPLSMFERKFMVGTIFPLDSSLSASLIHILEAGPYKSLARSLSAELKQATREHGKQGKVATAAVQTPARGTACD